MRNRIESSKSSEVSAQSDRSREFSLIQRWGFALVSLLALPLVACAAESETTVADDSAIYGGSLDQDNSSVVALRVQWPDKTELCSGSLIAPNVVLTARHCVSQQLVPLIQCDENGKSLNGDQLGGDVEAAQIKIYSNDSAEIAKTESARGRKIFHPTGSALCNADIAIVVLDKAIKTTEPLPVRLDGKVAASESLRMVGYGKNDLGSSLGTRVSRDRVGVLATGSGISEYNTALGEHEFEVGLSSCNGDSGGPAISEQTGAVVGVVSRGGNCSSDYGHVYTSTSGFASMFEAAFKFAGGHPIGETKTLSADEPDTDGDVAQASGCSATTTPMSSTTAGAGFAIALAALFARRTRKVRA